MSSLKASLTGGGIAKWGKFIPSADGLHTFTYETEGTMRLDLEGKEPLYFYGYLTGMDDINDEHVVVSGVGNLILKDLEGDAIMCKVDWFVKDGKDKGMFRFWSGTGKWEGIDGEIDVTLNPALTETDDKFGAFLEGEGTVSLK